MVQALEAADTSSIVEEASGAATAAATFTSSAATGLDMGLKRDPRE